MKKIFTALSRIKDSWLDIACEDEINVIQKGLDALYIIKDKKIDIELLLNADNAEEYNGFISDLFGEDPSKYLTQEEFDTVHNGLYQ